MTKKKKRQNPEAEELLARPWCYYCERDFDDLKILIAHQKAKHYKCERCGRRLNTAGGLRVHMEQVHKEQLEVVDNAIPGRESIELEIFGTEGIPESEVAAHNQRILAVIAQREADRRAASGQSGSGSKKPKLDISQELDPENIKKKLEAHKKAMAASQNSGSTGGTPVPPGNMSPGRSASPGQAGFDGQRSPAQAGFPQTASPPPPYQQGGYPMPQQPTGPYPASQTYPAQNQPPYGAPYHAPPFQQPPASFGRGTPPTGPGYNGFQPSSHQGFGPGYNPNPHNQYQQPPPPHLPRPPASSSLPQPHQIPGLPPRPSAPGLPPRPNFGNAAMNNGGFGRGGAGGWNQPPAHQQQMYPQAASPPNIAGFGGSGAYVPPPGQNQQSFAQPYSPHQQQQQQQQQSGFGAPPSPATHGMPQYPQSHNVSNGPNGQPRNDNRQLGATGMEEVNRVKVDTPNNGTPEVAPPPTTEKKKEEKPKRETRMVYSDNEISPEEKRAMLPRYEYHPPKSSVEAATTA